MELEELIRSNANLEDYLKEYGDNPVFLRHYYLQDLNRIAVNYYTYGSYLSNEDKFKLFELAIDSQNYYAINTIIHDIDSLCYDDNTKPLADKMFDNLIELDKNGKIDIGNITSSVYLYRRNPIYFIQKDAKYLESVGYLKKEEVLEVLKYLNSQNYMFSDKDRLFLDYNVFENVDTFVYFVNNCNISASLNITGKIGQMSKEDLYDLYPKIVNGQNVKAILDEIYNQLNYDNYDYNTIIKDHNLYLNYDKNNKENLSNFLKELIEKGFNANIILKMDRVDMEYINKIYPIVGDKLKISPFLNQSIAASVKGRTDLPYYDVDYIKKSEEKLDLYASMVDDKKDIDGDIKSLSPLEKYIAAYILTTKFAPYKSESIEDGDTAYTSRAVYEFINTTSNTKIVCAGYVNLFREILYRMGIKDTLHWAVSGESKDKNNTFQDHARMMIHLKDPKYGIDGIYMSDPTWDDHDITKKSVDHLLMSYDELLKIDPELTIKKLRADEDYIMDSDFGINNSHELFRKPIPKDAIIKAHLALDCFLDKYMKMPKDNEYNLLDYCEMAEKLQMYEVCEQYEDQVFQELQKYSIKEIQDNYPGLSNMFFYNIGQLIVSKLKEQGVDYNFASRMDSNDGTFKVGFKFNFNNEEFNDFEFSLENMESLKEMYPSGRIKNNTATAEFYVYEFDNSKTINEQMDDAMEKLQELASVAAELSSKKDNNRL